jgi:kinesin family protein 18/19
MASAPDVTKANDDHKEKMWAGQSNMLVAVRVRPLRSHDRSNRECIRVLDRKMVVVLDPSTGKDQNDILRQNRTREKKYAFDHVFEPEDNNQVVYSNTTKFLIDGILNGFNATVFAYGNTGAGKTYTMLGTPEEPGIMMLTLNDLFADIKAKQNDEAHGISFRPFFRPFFRPSFPPSSSSFLPSFLPSLTFLTSFRPSFLPSFIRFRSSVILSFRPSSPPSFLP